MPITIETVRHVALLARLELEPGEEERFAAELGAIVAHVDALRAVDVEGVPPTAHALHDAGAFRPDEVTNRPAPDELLGDAPDRTGDFFRVPKIIE